MNNNHQLEPIFQSLIDLVQAQSDQIGILKEKLDQLEVGAGGGGGNATIVDYTPGTTYKRNTLVVYNETVYRVCVLDEYTAVDFETDYHGDGTPGSVKLKLVGFESSIVTYGSEPTQEEVNNLPQDTLVAIYNSADDPYNLT